MAIIDLPVFGGDTTPVPGWAREFDNPGIVFSEVGPNRYLNIESPGPSPVPPPNNTTLVVVGFGYHYYM